MIRTLTTLVVLLSAATGLSAGNPPEWERPEQAEFPVVQGQGWTRELGGSYRRLPDRPRFSYRRPYGNYPLTRPERPSISSRTRPKSAYVTG